MTDRHIIVAVRSAAGGGMALALTGTGVSLAAGHLRDWWTGHYGVATVLTVGLSAVVWLVIPSQPRNPAVWATATAPLGGLVVLAYSVAPFLADAEPSALRYPDYIPAEHPASLAALFMVAQPASAIGVFVPVTFGLLLFPDGSLPGRRWRPVGWFAAGSIAAMCAAYLIAERPAATRNPEEWWGLGSAQLVALVAMVLSIVAVFVRFRSSSGDTRQQIKWVLWGGSVAGVAFSVGMVTVDESDGWFNPLLIFTGFAVLIVSYGVAIARTRLYDVDLVISRTIVFGLLAVVITGVYVGLVVGVGELIGSSDGPNTALAIAATGMVAVAFQPLRTRLQQVADRLVYGKKATAHEVLSEFSRRVAANDDSLLDLVARSLVEGTGADRAGVLIAIDGRLVSAAEWPRGDARPDDEVTSLPINQDGVKLGALSLSVSHGQRLTEQDLLLAGQVASGLALALRNRVLTQTLERRVEELRRSRRRLVAVQDETRRQLERDLHDGAQQQLVALKVKLGLARSIGERDGATETAAMLGQLIEGADVTVDAMRDFARGVYPPLLEAEGLGPVISAHARGAPIPVAVSTEGIARYERQVESTVNVCVVEALRNVVRHSRARAAHVVVAQQNGSLTFEIRDDGVGFDPSVTPRGAGLTTMADRIDAVAGNLEVRSEPGGGTTVTASIPVETTPSAPETAADEPMLETTA